MREPIKLMNMCMVTAPDGKVLVQNRKKGDYDGLTFPGGKVEPGESLIDSVVREVQEETGLTICDPKLCGISNWYYEDGVRNMVLLYKTNMYSGKLRDSSEGHMEWLTVEELLAGNCAFATDDMLRVFFEDDITEMWYHNSPDSWERTLH